MRETERSRSPEELETHLRGLIEASREQAAEDPFRNPVLAVTLAITRRFDRAEIAEDDLDALFVRLRAQALAERAGRLRAYVGLDGSPDGREGADAAVRARLVAVVPQGAGDFEAFRERVGRTAFAVVFTAHPTFGMPRAVAALLARSASLADPAAREPLIAEAAALSTRPDAKISLDDEFDQACIAANHARAALDGFTGALIDAARRRWPDRWTELVPRPLAVASWVGCDTDGRTDIGWWDTLRYRLDDRQQGRAMAKVVATMVRSAERSFRRAFAPGLAEVRGPHRNLRAGRRTAWLTADELRVLNGYVERIHALFARGRPQRPGARLHEFTYVLAPIVEKGRRTRGSR